MSAAYGEDDIGRFEDGDDKASGDEDSGESSRNSVGSLSLSNLVSLFHTAPCQRYFSVCFGSLRDVNPLHSCLCRKWSLTRGETPMIIRYLNPPLIVEWFGLI